MRAEAYVAKRKVYLQIGRGEVDYLTRYADDTLVFTLSPLQAMELLRELHKAIEVIKNEGGTE